MSIKYDTQHSN